MAGFLPDEEIKLYELELVTSSGTKNFRLQILKEEFNPFNGGFEAFRPELLTSKTIYNLFCVRAMIIALTTCGLCAAYSRAQKDRICYLNKYGDERIEKLHYNNSDESLITVCTYASDNYETVTCWSTQLQDIERNIPHVRRRVFEDVALRKSYDVGFDNFNAKAFISTLDETIKIFDLTSYTCLFEVPVTMTSIVTSSPGLMVEVNTHNKDIISIRGSAVDNGNVVTEFTYELNSDFKEKKAVILLNEKVLIIDGNWRLNLINLLTAHGECRQCFMPFTDRIQMPDTYTFLTLRDSIMRLWDSDGHLIREFEDHPLCQEHFFCYETQITSDGFIISHCSLKQKCENRCDGEHIHIINMKDGTCVTKLCQNDPSCSSHPDKEMVFRAIKNISSVFYDEQSYEIFTGCKFGQVHLWSR